MVEIDVCVTVDTVEVTTSDGGPLGGVTVEVIGHVVTVV